MNMNGKVYYGEVQHETMGMHGLSAHKNVMFHLNNSTYVEFSDFILTNMTGQVWYTYRDDTLL